jgi:hypothetical protein
MEGASKNSPLRRGAVSIPEPSTTLRAASCFKTIHCGSPGMVLPVEGPCPSVGREGNEMGGLLRPAPLSSGETNRGLHQLRERDQVVLIAASARRQEQRRQPSTRLKAVNERKPGFDRLVDRKPAAPVAISNRIPPGRELASPMRRLDPQDKEAQPGLEQGSLK